MHEPALRAAAFGSDPLPDPAVTRGAGSPRERLLAAIVLGAQGRYAAAAALLDALRRGSDPLMASLAASTLAAHRRQLGGHRQARALDGEAYATAAGLAGGSAQDLRPAGPAQSSPGPGRATAPVRDPDGSRSPVRGLGGVTSPASGPGGVTSPVGVPDGVTSPAPGSGGVMSPVRAPDGTTSPVRGPDGATSPVRALDCVTSPVPGSGGVTSPVGAPDGATSPVRGPDDTTSPVRDPDGLDAAGARADALLGLAADNLALGGLAAARRLAARAAEEDSGWRATVRGGWVGAEIELAAGQGAAAVPHAERAFETARARGARRHAVKSGIVLAVALRAAGAPDHREISDGLVGNAMATAEECELLSLLWPAALVMADLRPGHAEEYRFRTAEVLHAVLRSADPCGRRIAGESPWVPAPGG